jgi:hypothetical protein
VANLFFFWRSKCFYDVIKIKNSFSSLFKFAEIPTNSKELISILLLINCKRLISAASFPAKECLFGLQNTPVRTTFLEGNRKAIDFYFRFILPSKLLLYL